MIDQRMAYVVFFVLFFLNNLSFFSCLTNAVAVCKAKDAFDLVECHMLLDLYHIPVELRRGTAENKLKLTQKTPKEFILV